MLVLSRKKNESIRIGTDGEIKITIVDISGDKVRIGIEVSKEVPIRREEVWVAYQREQD